MNQLTNSQTIVVPFKNLVISDGNVRTSYSEHGLKELAASIHYHGLLENLVVKAIGGDRFEVVAGGRRLMAIGLNVEAGHATSDFPVLCKVVNGNETELSLAENIVREAMHPLDEFHAFDSLNAEGCDIQDIALRFGKSEKFVLKRLKLGRVHPDIRGAYAQQEIDLQTLEAFCLTDDKERQLSVFQSLCPYVHWHSVKRCLTDNSISSTQAEAKLVDRDEYVARGGQISHDLFSENEEFFYEDAALVHELSLEKLEAHTEAFKSEGWKWVKYGFSYSDIRESVSTRIYPERQAFSDDDQALYDELDHKRDSLARNSDEFESVSAQITELEQKYDYFDPEEMAFAGVFLSLDYRGDIVVQRGLILKDDAKEYKERCNLGISETSGSEPKSPYSKALQEDLIHARTYAFQESLKTHQTALLDVVIFSAVQKHYATMDFHNKGADLQIQRLAALPYNWFEKSGIEEPKMPEKPEWLESADVAENYQNFTALPLETKLSWFNLLFAESFSAMTQTQNTAFLQGLSAQLSLDMPQAWRPTRINFWNRVSKNYILSVLSDVIDPSFAKQISVLSKSELADLAEELFSGREVPGFTPQQLQRAERWLPEGMGVITSHDEVFEDIETPDAAPAALPAEETESARDEDHAELPDVFDVA